MTTALKRRPGLSFVERMQNENLDAAGRFDVAASPGEDLKRRIAERLYARLPLAAHGEGGVRANSVDAYLKLAADSDQELTRYGPEHDRFAQAVLFAGMRWLGPGPVAPQTRGACEVGYALPNAMYMSILPMRVEARLRATAEDARRHFVDAAWAAAQGTARCIVKQLETCFARRLIGRIEYVDETSAFILHHSAQYVPTVKYTGGWVHPLEERSLPSSTGAEVIELRPVRNGQSGSFPPHILNLWQRIPHWLAPDVVGYFGRCVREAKRKDDRASPHERPVYKEVGLILLANEIVLAYWDVEPRPTLLQLILGHC